MIAIPALLTMIAVIPIAQAQISPNGRGPEDDSPFVPFNPGAVDDAKNLQFSISKGDIKNVILWGTIASGDSERVRVMLSTAKRVNEILLLSGGGSLEDGLEIGRIIRQNKLTTRIPAEFKCMSACNFMFMGGIVRYVEPGGKFGVHMFAFGESTEKDILDAIRSPQDPAQVQANFSSMIKSIQRDAAQNAAQIARFLVEMRLSLRFLTEFANIPNERPRALTRDELRDFNIVNDK